MEMHRNRRSVIVAAATTALVLVGAGGAFAQQASTVAGGTTTDSGMPQIQQQGDVSFVSGGVGSDESKALERAQSQWPLSLRFAGSGSEYLADVRVKIDDGHGANVLTATSSGPYMLVRLRPGRYTVHAAYKDVDQSKEVVIPAKGGAKSVFHWNAQ